MSIQTHIRVGRALADTAHAFNLRPFDVKVLVVLDVLGGKTTSDRLNEALLQIEGSNVRRSLLALRPLNLLSGGDKRGSREPIILSRGGRTVVCVFREVLGDIEASQLDNGLREVSDGVE